MGPKAVFDAVVGTETPEPFYFPVNNRWHVKSRRLARGGPGGGHRRHAGHRRRSPSGGFESVAGGLDRLRVVDCTGATAKGTFDDTDDVKYVASPGDLTGIGMGIVKCTRDMGESVDGLRLGVLSLSTLLRYSDPDRVFNFLHTVTGRVSAADYLGIATLDPGAHDPQDVNTLSSQFDVVVELREADDDGREARVVGHHESPRTWKAL